MRFKVGMRVRIVKVPDHFDQRHPYKLGTVWTIKKLDFYDSDKKIPTVSLDEKEEWWTYRDCIGPVSKLDKILK